MVSRAITTCVIWCSALLMMAFLIERLAITQVTSYVNASADQTMPFMMPVYETVFAPGGIQVAIVFLCILILIAAAGVTSSIWKNAGAFGRQPSAETSLRAEQHHALKHKREARRRAHALLDQLSDDELEQLEHDYLVDGEGQSIPLEALMAQDQAARSAR